jgi:hypothetical protein
MVHTRNHTAKHRKRTAKGGYKKLVLKGIIKGGDASTYATAVYGAPEQQHAVSESNNVIAMNTVPCGQTGGDAVPAADVTSMSPAAVDAALAPEPVPMQGGAADPAAPVVSGGVAHTAAPVAPAVAAHPAAHPVAHQAGGKRINQRGGLLTDLAVPAVLLVANQAMTKRRRKSGKKSYKHRKGHAHKKR